MSPSTPLPASEPDAITVDSANQEIVYDSRYISTVGSYSATVTAFHDTISTNESFDFTVIFFNPCLIATFTMSSIFDSLDMQYTQSTGNFE